MKSVYVVWQEHITRMWHPVAKLSQVQEDLYTLNYTNGAKNPNFSPFPRMTDKTKTYSSSALFSFFKNRIIPESRPEHYSLLEWSGLSVDSKDYLEILALSGGERKTDSFRIISIPEKENNQYRNIFFASAIKYLSEEVKSQILNFKPEQELYFKFEEDNEIDPYAVLLLDTDKTKNVGYYPHFLTCDLKELCDLSDVDNVKIKVLKVNVNAPDQFRLLCETIAPWPDGFESCASDEFKDFT